MTEALHGARRPVTRWARSIVRVCVVATLVTLTLGGGAASAYWTAGSVVGGAGVAAPAAAVNPGAQPTATAAKTVVTVGWTASTLSNGTSVSGYVVKRFDAATGVQAAVLAGCAGTITALTCTESGVPEGRWVYSVTPRFATNWAGAEGPRSAPVASDSTAPVNVVTFAVVSGGAFKEGSTLFFRGVAAGSFTLSNALTDAGSGPASSASGPLSGGAGLTHTPTTVSTPAGGPFVSGLFSWPAGSTVTQGVTMTGRDVAGNTAATALTLVNDSTAPTGGALTYLNGTTARTSVSVAFATVTDGGSGVGTRLLQRATASLTNGTCGAWAAFQTVAGGTNPVSPLADTVSVGNCYKYQYVVSDNVGNQTVVSSASVVKVSTYRDAVNATTGLLSYWRLGESAALLDPFGGTAGTAVQSWNGAGIAWTQNTDYSTTDAVITAQGRIRKQGSSVGATYYSSISPASADYTVAADVTMVSAIANDQIGIVGRVDPGNSDTFYAAVYDQSDGCWTLDVVVNKSISNQRSSCALPLAVGTTHRLELVMVGRSITLRVDGSDLVSFNDNRISIAGRGGVLMGFNGSATQLTDTTGLQLDNFTITPQAIPAVADSVGSNDGVYLNGPTLGVQGAIPGDPDTAATFDGVNDYGRVAREISDDFSIELWFRSTQKVGTGQAPGTGTQWWQGAGLVDAEVDGAKRDFGVSLFSDGRVVAGVGYAPSDVSILSGPGYNDGRWHHVVFTRTWSSGVMALYVDGASQGTAIGDKGSLIASNYLTFGRIQTGTYSFAGSLDEVAIYTTVLTPETVLAHYVPVP